MQCQFNVPLFGINEKRRLPKSFNRATSKRIIIVTEGANHDNTRTRLQHLIIKLVCYLLPLLSVKYYYYYMYRGFLQHLARSSSQQISLPPHPVNQGKKKRKKKKIPKRGLGSGQKWAGKGLEGWVVQKKMSSTWHGFASHAPTEKHYLF